MQYNHIKKWVAGATLLAALGMIAGCDSKKATKPEQDGEGACLFENLEGVDVDEKNRTITLDERVDSLVINSFDMLDGVRFFVANDDDPVDPTFDWENELEEGSVIQVGDTNEVRLVVLDGDNRTVAVWTILLPENVKSSSSSKKGDKKSSSSAESVESSDSDDDEVDSSGSEADEESASSSAEGAESSSSDEKVESSNSEEIAESSASEVESSSSEEEPAVESSSSVVEAEPESSSSSSEELVPESSSSEEIVDSGSSEVESSSSEEEPVVESSSSSEDPAPESSSSEIAYVNVKSLTVSGGTVSVSGSKVYVEMPYGSNLKNIKFNQLDEVLDLVRPVEMQFADNGEVRTFSVVAGMQLPGSDFSARNDFWATTSDAMEKEGTSKCVVTLKISSEKNAIFDGNQVALTSKVVTATGLGIFKGGWKLGGGFYYAGTFSGTDASSIYQADNDDGCADGCPADFSQYMTHGKTFAARPASFEVTYSYNHEDNSSADYPQKALIYVMLVSADKKIVASGVITESATKDMGTKTVQLAYGSDSGLLSSGYALQSGLTVGNGDEEVATIHVMFASSAYAFIAAGGTAALKDGNYRGAEGASLTIDNFKLNY